MKPNEIYPRATVADLCRLHGVTPRALRYYESEGLIAPVRDRRNRRSYDARVRADLRIVIVLRRAGLALCDIRAFLEFDDGAGDEKDAQAFLRGKLAHRQAELHDALAAVEQAAQALGVSALPQGAPGLDRQTPDERAVRKLAGSPHQAGALR